MSNEVVQPENTEERRSALSVTGKPLVKGDRLLYLCQCLRPSCPTGQRATVLDREQVVAYFPDEAEAPASYVYIKFDTETAPNASEANQFIHLSDLGLPESCWGTVEQQLALIAKAKEQFEAQMNTLMSTTPEVN